ncbi:crotonobetaine/carnitine-CoA ligase [Rhodoligotrophos appendicifer]
MIALAQPAVILADEASLAVLTALDTNVQIGGPREIELMTSSMQAWGDRPKVAVKGTDPNRILFTSGTSGPSKGIELSHAYEVLTGHSYLRPLAIDSSARWLYLTPICHIDAIYIMSILLQSGGCFALAPNFSVSRFWSDVHDSAATHLCYVGAILSLILKGQYSPPSHTLRIALGGGASAAQIEAFETRFGVMVLEAFAMSECIACTMNHPGARRPGTVGTPLEGVLVAIAAENGRLLSPGETGEILVQSRERQNLFTRYLGHPKLTELAFLTGWFRTGDLGVFDVDGYLTYKGRMGDAIRCKGENVSAAELEAIADAHQNVVGSAAVAIPSDLGEDDILLYVEAVEPRKFDPEELVSFIASNAAAFMVPRYIHLLDRLPRTATQKPDKTGLARAPQTATWRRPGVSFPEGPPAPQIRASIDGRPDP